MRRFMLLALNEILDDLERDNIDIMKSKISNSLDSVSVELQEINFVNALNQLFMICLSKS